jgi:hypothetical protein
MRFSAGFFVAVVLSFFLLTETQCNKTPASPGITSYSYIKPIVNPPDTFQVAYDLNFSGNLIAHITFQDSAVWRIQVLTQSPITYGFIDPAKDSMVYIKSTDTVGFRGNFQYSFIANNVNNDQYKDLYFVKFTKLPIDYHTFPKRY